MLHSGLELAKVLNIDDDTRTARRHAAIGALRMTVSGQTAQSLVPVEDAVRGATMALDEVAGQVWTRKHDDVAMPVVHSALRTVYSRSLEGCIDPHLIPWYPHRQTVDLRLPRGKGRGDGKPGDGPNDPCKPCCPPRDGTPVGESIKGSHLSAIGVRG